MEGTRKKIEAFIGDEDRLWNRGADGTPIFHHGVKSDAAVIEAEMGPKLYKFVKECKPDIVVEVGTNRGYSGSWIALALSENKKGKLLTYDPQDYQPKVYEQVGLKEWVEFRQSGTLEDLPGQIDFTFIDSSHTVADTQREVNTILPKIRSKGIATFHDTQLCMHCGNVIRDYLNGHSNEWAWEEIKEGRGLIVAHRR